MPIANTDFQAAEIKKLKAEEESLMKVLFEQDRVNELDKKRMK